MAANRAQREATIRKTTQTLAERFCALPEWWQRWIVYQGRMLVPWRETKKCKPTHIMYNRIRGTAQGTLKRIDSNGHTMQNGWGLNSRSMNVLGAAEHMFFYLDISPVIDENGDG